MGSRWWDVDSGCQLLGFGVFCLYSMGRTVITKWYSPLATGQGLAIVYVETFIVFYKS